MYFDIYLYDKTVSISYVTETVKKVCEGLGQLLSY